MEQLTIIFCAALVVLASFLADQTVASPHNEERSIDAYSKRKSNALWFGPRLGRRKRNPNGDETYRTPALEREQIDALMELIQESPWAIVAVNEGQKRHTVNFTPRLGRESGEDTLSGSGDRWPQDADLGGEMISQRSPPFAPRLGRRNVSFSPRLGREVERP